MEEWPANPWLQVTKKVPYVAQIDSEVFDNDPRLIEKSDIRTEVLPEPYVGNPFTAEVYLLNLNPGFDEADLDNMHNEKYVASVDANLRHQANPGFIFFSEALKWTKGYKWAMQHFAKPLVDEGVGIESLSKKLMSIEYMPYHSRNYKYNGKAFPSQEYSLWLIRRAMRLGKIIVILRKKREWLDILPELSEYPYYELNNKQRVYLSRNNFRINGSEAYEKILSVLKS